MRYLLQNLKSDRRMWTPTMINDVRCYRIIYLYDLFISIRNIRRRTNRCENRESILLITRRAKYSAMLLTRAFEINAHDSTFWDEFHRRYLILAWLDYFNNFPIFISNSFFFSLKTHKKFDFFLTKNRIYLRTTSNYINN